MRTKLGQTTRSWLLVALVLVGLAASGLLAGWLLLRYDRTVAFAAEADRLARVLRIAPGMTVGDVRAGTGRWTVDLARRVGPRGHVYATAGPDPPHELLATIAAAGLDNVTVVTRMPGAMSRLPPGCCDAVLIRAVYHRLRRDRPAFVTSLIEALRPGGRVAVIDFDAGTAEYASGHGVARRIVIDEFRKAGLELVEDLEDWEGHAYCLVFRRPEPSATP